MKLDVIAFVGLIIAISGLILNNFSPEWTAVMVLLTTGVLAAVRRSLFHPALFLTIGLTFILLLGGLNISNYRGIVSSENFEYILKCILILSGSAAAVTLFPPGQPRYTPRLPVIRYWAIIAAALPAIIGVAWIVGTVGIPLLKPSSRFLANPNAAFLAETATAAAALIAYRFYINRYLTIYDRELILLIALLLLIPGYRNWVVVAALIAVIGLTRAGAIQQRLMRTLALLLIALAFLGMVSEFRRAVSPELMSSDATIARYHVEYLPGFAAQLHLGFRESIALSAHMIDSPPDLQGKDVFFADLMTLLPGKHESGGKILGEHFGTSLAGGLTPGLVGMLTVEYGRFYCMIIFAVFGVFVGYLWRRSGPGRSPDISFFYAFFIVDFLLLFHRGIIKPGMVVVPLYFLVLTVALRLLRRSTVQTATPTRQQGAG